MEDLPLVEDFEKPLSPILSTSKVTRNFGKSLSRRKSKTKLLDKFNTVAGSSPNASSATEQFDNNSAVGQLLELEALEREDAQQLESFYEKTRKFPETIQAEEVGNVVEPQQSSSCDCRPDDILADLKVAAIDNKTMANMAMTFTTASGIKIGTSSKGSTMSKQLFNDILDPNNDLKRARKYNFLKKSATSGINESLFHGFSLEDADFSNRIIKRHETAFELLIQDNARKLKRPHSPDTFFEMKRFKFSSASLMSIDCKLETELKLDKVENVLFAKDNCNNTSSSIESHLVNKTKTADAAEQFVHQTENSSKIQSHDAGDKDDSFACSTQIEKLLLETEEKLYVEQENIKDNLEGLNLLNTEIKKSALDVIKSQNISAETLQNKHNETISTEVAEESTRDNITGKIIVTTVCEKSAKNTSDISRGCSPERREESFVATTGWVSCSEITSVNNSSNLTAFARERNLEGFTSASGKPVCLSSTAFQKAKQLFVDTVLVSENTEINEDSELFKQPLPISVGTPTRLKNMFKNVGREPLNITGTGFLLSSDKSTSGLCDISCGSDIGKDQNSTMVSVDYEKSNQLGIDQTTFKGFLTGSGRLLQVPSSSSDKVKQIFEGIDISSNYDDPGRTESASKAEDTLEVGKHDSAIAREELTKIDLKRNRLQGFPNSSGSKLSMSAQTLAKVRNIFEGIDIDVASFSKSLQPSLPRAKNPTHPTSASPVSHAQRKPGLKRLGTSSLKPMAIPQIKLEAAKSVFGDICQDLPSHVESPNRSKNPRIFHSTPIKGALQSTISCSKAMTTLRQTDNHFEPDFTMTPDNVNLFAKMIFRKPTPGDLMSWTENAHEQRIMLERKLNLVAEKYRILMEQLGRQISSKQIERNYGLHYQSKRKQNLFTLKQIQNSSDSIPADMNETILRLTPQNADFFHFNFHGSNIASIPTMEGAVVVPSLSDVVGLAEISSAFTLMPGVDKKLIPEGWIKNHFKWIVWKLACYERMLFENLAGCLSIECIIQQLRYRYDRELYNAERPALRKIYEKDDVAQKRLVLCVSNIYKDSNKTELELTDGWYSIKALIDEPLAQQVTNSKIKIGTKLITCGAEILNCEGCHPLETDGVKARLRISYNSTRRSLWYLKLGYQKNPYPFRVSLDSINPAGGAIGCVIVYIARVYPLRFMEKSGIHTVWRNKKAEEKRQREMEEEFTSKDSGQEVKIATPVLRLLVVDTAKPDKFCNFTIWGPTDFHLDNLKEHTIYKIYNLQPKPNGDISACNKTMFFNVCKVPEVFTKFRRKLTPFGELPKQNLDFREFDTVGVVLEATIAKIQELWLTNLDGRLLCVKIYDSNTACSLIDNVKPKQAVALSNLVLFECKEDYIGAVANQFTVVSCYPQQQHLQEGLRMLESISESTISFCYEKLQFLNNSKKLLGNSNTSANKTISKRSMDESILDYSLVTSTDIAMSKINIDKYINESK